MIIININLNLIIIIIINYSLFINLIIYYTNADCKEYFCSFIKRENINNNE